MIYLDNAATSMQKHPGMEQVFSEALLRLGNPGRGAYEPSLQAARTVFSARRRVNRLLNGEGAECVAFTHNATYALNMALHGILGAGDHVLTSVCEHNSVLRPLYALERQGVEVTRLGCDEYGRISLAELRGSMKNNTKAIVLAHASNVTGNIADLEAIGRLARERGVLLLVDAAQTAGCFPIDVQQMEIDILCFTGHKGLLGIQGTGGLYVRPGVKLLPWISGGSGVHSFLHEQPEEMPAALEAGTLNVHGLACLDFSLGYSEEHGLTPAAVHKHELQLAQAFIDGIRHLPNVRLYGDYRDGSQRAGIVSLNIGHEDAGSISDALWERWGICTRAGIHCAPLLHQALGTARQGIVRFSFGLYNTPAEAGQAAQAVCVLAKELL